MFQFLRAPNEIRTFWHVPQIKQAQQMNLKMLWLSCREDTSKYFSFIPILHCHDKLANYILGSRLLSRRKGATAELKDHRLWFRGVLASFLVTPLVNLQKKNVYFGTSTELRVSCCCFRGRFFSFLFLFFFSFFLNGTGLKAQLQVIQKNET